MRLRVMVGIALAAAAFVLACAGTHPAPRFSWDAKQDFTSLKTFAWYSDPTLRMPHGDSIADGRFLDSHIRAAVEADLAKKGYRRVESDADLLVAYHTGQTGVASQDEFGVYDWWWFPVTDWEGTDYEKERSLVIDVRNGHRRLVWRGAIQRLEGTNPDAVAREIDRTVTELLERFPPAPGAVPPPRR